MKYFFSILFILAIVHPAHATMAVKGEVPDIPPVMTPPAFVEPNVKNNAQYSNPQYLDVNPEEASQKNQSADGGGSNVTESSNEPVYKKSSLWIWLFFIFAGLAGIFVWLKKKSQSI